MLHYPVPENTNALNTQKGTFQPLNHNLLQQHPAAVGTTLIPVVLMQGYMIVWKRTASYATQDLSQTSNEPIVKSAVPAQKIAMAGESVVGA